MASPDTLSELPATRDHTVVVLVSAVDRRIVPALRFVNRLACTEARALHVSVDADETRRLAEDWMTLGLSWLPLHIEVATADDLAVAVREAVRHVADTAGRVTVVVPELVLTRWWQQMLHRRSARRIAVLLQRLPRVTAVVVPVSPAAAGSVVEERRVG